MAWIVAWGRESARSYFSYLPVFCWIRERINLAGCLHVSGPYRCLFYEFQEYHPPVCPAARFLALLSWIEACVWCYHHSLSWSKKLKKKKNSLTLTSLSWPWLPDTIGHFLCWTRFRSRRPFRTSCQCDITILSDATGPEANLLADSGGEEHFEFIPIHQAHLTPVKEIKASVDLPCTALPVLPFPFSGILFLIRAGLAVLLLLYPCLYIPPLWPRIGFIEFWFGSAGKQIVLQSCIITQPSIPAPLELAWRSPNWTTKRPFGRPSITLTISSLGLLPGRTGPSRPEPFWTTNSLDPTLGHRTTLRLPYSPNSKSNQTRNLPGIKMAGDVGPVFLWRGRGLRGHWERKGPVLLYEIRHGGDAFEWRYCLCLSWVARMSETKKEWITILVFFSIVGWIYVSRWGCIRGFKLDWENGVQIW